MRWLSEAAKQGDPLAQANLGAMYYRGEGVGRNLQVAAEWFEKAAAQGITEAQFDVACIYEAGNGVQQNIGKAFKFYLDAAKVAMRQPKTTSAFFTRTEKGWSGITLKRCCGS
jgi:TPR repeat protein